MLHMEENIRITEKNIRKNIFFYFYENKWIQNNIFCGEEKKWDWNNPY